MGKPVGRICGYFLWALPGLITFFLPLLVLSFIIGPVLSALLPLEWFNTRTLHFFNATGKEFELFARDLDGRMNISVISAAILAAGLGAIVYAYFVVWRRFNYAIAIVIVALAVSVGFYICLSGGDNRTPECPKTAEPATLNIPGNLVVGFRAIVLDNVICVAEREKKTAPGALVTMRKLILWNSMVGFAGAASVMAAMAVIALRGGQAPVVMRLRRRLDAFKTLTLVASMLFVLNALISKALAGWVQGLLDPSEAANFGKLSGALLNYWAAQTSVILFVTIVCAAAGLRAQIDSAAEEAMKPAATRQSVTEKTWKETNGLVFETSTVLSAAIGTIAPLLAGPAVDLVSSTIKAVH